MTGVSSSGGHPGDVAGAGSSLGRAVVITASDRAAAGVYPDRGGPVLVAGLQEMGFQVADAVVVADGDPVGAALRRAVADQVDVVLTTGGTGVTVRDRTPEQTADVIERELPGIAEAIRAFGAAKGVPTAVLSRGLAGVAGRTVIINLPGSTGGCRDGLQVLRDVLPHLVAQLAGEGHDA